MLDMKYRFGEIMSAVSMLPDISMDNDDAQESMESMKDVILPNLTKDIANGNLRDAILCQAFRENEEFKFKLVALLSNSALKRFNECQENDTKPSEDDLEAIAISANILWSIGHTRGLYQMLGVLGTVCSMTDTDLPLLATAFLRPTNGIENFGRLDPIAILEGNVSPKEVLEASVQDDGE
jgi:hypothetical protein